MADPAVSPKGSSKVVWCLLTAIVLVGAALRFAHLDYGLPNYHQVGGVFAVRFQADEGKLSRQVSTMLESRNPFRVLNLTYPPLHAWLTCVPVGMRWLAGGEAPVWFVDMSARIVAVLASSGAILVAFWLGARWNSLTGVLAALLLAVCPVAVVYARWANPDPLCALFFALSAGLAIHIVCTGGTSRLAFAMLGLMIGLATVSKYFGVFLLHIPLLGWLAARGWRLKSLWEREHGFAWLWAYLTWGAVVFFGLGLVVLLNPGSYERFASWAGAVSGTSAWWGHRGQLPANRPMPHYAATILPHALTWPLYLMALAGIGHGLVVRDRLIFLALLCCLPLYLFLEACHLRADRYALSLTTFLCVFSARGLATMMRGGRPLVALGGGLIAVLAGYALVVSAAKVSVFDMRHDFRMRAAHWIQAHLPAGADLGVTCKIPALTPKWMLTPADNLPQFHRKLYEDYPRHVLLYSRAYETFKHYFESRRDGYEYTTADWAPAPPPGPETLRAFEDLVFEKRYQLIGKIEQSRSRFGVDLTSNGYVPGIRIYERKD